MKRNHRGAIAYLVFGLLVLGLYGYAEATGREYTLAQQKVTVPPDVRSSPGGYRSFHFWHSGYHGGK